MALVTARCPSDERRLAHCFFSNGHPLSASGLNARAPGTVSRIARRSIGPVDSWGVLARHLTHLLADRSGGISARRLHRLQIMRDGGIGASLNHVGQVVAGKCLTVARGPGPRRIIEVVVERGGAERVLGNGKS